MIAPLDDKNQTWVAAMQASLDATHRAIQQGHVVRFADGTMRVVSHVWHDEANQLDAIQTSDMTGDARLHLSSYAGTAYLEYSGGLYGGVPFSTFTLSPHVSEVTVWLWHHQIAGAGRGVYTTVRVPIWDCSLMPNSV